MTPPPSTPASPSDGVSERAAAEDANGDDEDVPTGREIDRGPTPLSSVLAIAASAIATIAASTGATAGAALAALGVVLLAGGVLTGSRRLVDGTGLTLLAGIAIAGTADAPEYWVLVAVAAAVVAWDVAGNAIGLGEQLGRNADTAPAELAHAAASVAVAAVTAALAYALYLVAGTNQPITAVVFLLAAAAVLLAVLR